MQIKVKDIPIYYEIYGSGQPIVMIHGWSVDHRLMKGCMEPVFAAHDTTWQRIYFDLPGMGQTPSAPWINGSDAMLDVVLGLIEAVIPGQSFAVAGESYGGYLARGVIKALPAKVNGVLLICPVGNQDTLNRNLPQFTVLEKDEALLARLSEDERASLTSMNVVQNERFWKRYKEEVVPAVKMADYTFLEKTLSQHVPFGSDVDQIEAPYPQPALFLMGRQDHCVGYRDQWRFIENFPRATFAILDKAGHNLQIEQDVLFTALVKEWLQRVKAEN